MGPLTGIRVLEIGDRGEVAGKLLADAGADVLKIEPGSGAASRRIGPFVDDQPGNDRSLFYAYWNTNKRGLTLDLADPDGAAIWRRLVEGVDVVIDASPPDHLDGLGCGHEAFAAQTQLIWCSLTPFGLTGPWRDFAATDLVSVALGGPMMSTGYDDHDQPPIRPDGMHSLAMGGEYAVAGILTALFQRGSSGRGQFIDVSIHECVSATTEGAFNRWEYERRIAQRQTGRHAQPETTLKWQIQCADGDYVVLMGGGMPRDERVWDALMAWMDETGASAPIKDPVYRDRGARTREHRDLIYETIHKFVESRTAEEVYRRAQDCHLPWGYVRRAEQNLDDPHWHDRGFFLEGEVSGHGEPAFYPGPAYRFSATPIDTVRRAPLLGEHNFEVFGTVLGYSVEQLVALSERGAI